MKNINKYVEHTLLKQDATKEDLDRVLYEAKKYNFLGVCIMPPHVKYAKEYLKGTDIKVVTVLGFPLGTTYMQIKVAEAILAVKDGADEVDMVLNVSALKNKDYQAVGGEILSVVQSVKNTPVKVIIETDLLTKDEIRIATQLVCKTGAKFVKTSTGFVKNGVGAKVEDVKLMYEIASKYNVGVKASGGIKTYQDAVKLIEAGATRLGTSSGVAIVEGANFGI
ncbi:MAG: deoxyribose-phosphate aldolase [Candidatus Gastranaerophilales bacterium]|nr:deoxyribose-phosphate aldolase [Candidatus Gastranaerophilales bacterium]